MGVEIGVIIFIFGYDEVMGCYLCVIGCIEIVDFCDGVVEYFIGDVECYVDFKKYFDQVIEIDFFILELYINGFYILDCVWLIFEFVVVVKEYNFFLKLEVGLIGFCINFSYEDFDCVVSLVCQVKVKNLKVKFEFMIMFGFE